MKLTHPCKDTCSGYSQDCAQQVEALRLRVRELEAENIYLKSCPNESWECQKYQRKLEAENDRLRKILSDAQAMGCIYKNNMKGCPGCFIGNEMELDRAERGGG